MNKLIEEMGFYEVFNSKSFFLPLIQLRLAKKLFFLHCNFFVDFTWSRSFGINCFRCFNLWANVRKIAFTWVWEWSDLAETSKSGRKFESAKRWALCLDTSWLSRSFFVPTSIRGISWFTKCCSASDNHEGRARKLDSLKNILTCFTVGKSRVSII